MNKIKIFLSSRVNSAINSLDAPYTLAELRSFIRDELKSETFLGKEMLEILINELSFNSTIGKNAFDNCMQTMRECNIIIILYNGEAGWSIADSASANGICHEEFLIAVNEFSDMSFMVDLSSFFELSKKGDEKRKNDLFASEVASSFPHKETIKAADIKQLKEKTLTQIKQYILKAVEKSFKTQKDIVAGSGVFGDTLDWSKLSYAERNDVLGEKLEKVFKPIQGLKDTIKAFHVVPDNMSVADARNMIGRPFLHEHKLIGKEKSEAGIIHSVAVYGNTTEIQVKNLVGFPDLAVVKTSFGFYLWEKNMHIQMFFLRNCVNPQTVKTRFSEVTNWLNSSKEQSKIIARARARYSILKAVGATNDVN